MGEVVDKKRMQNLMSVKGLLAQLSITLPVGIAALFIFSFLRTRNKDVYARRLKYPLLKDSQRPPPLPDGLLSWIRPVLAVTNDQLITMTGLDAALFIRFLSWTCNLFLFLGILLSFTLIPVNYMASRKSKQFANMTDFTFEKISIIAAQGYPSYLWAHVAMTWVVSLIIIVAVFRLGSEFFEMRQNYFESEEYQDSVNGRSMLLVHVPKVMQTEEAILDFLRRHQVFHKQCVASIARHLGELPKLISKHDVAIRTLESALHNFLKDPSNIPKERPTMREKLFGPKIDLIDKLTAEITDLEAQIEQARQHSKEFKPSPTAFVTYPTVVLAHKATRLLRGQLSHLGLKGGEKHPDVKLAPPVEDMMWGNAQVGRAAHTARKYTGILIYLIFLFFGLVFIGWLSTLANLNAMRETSPSVAKFAEKHPTLFASISSSVTPLITVVFFAILPQILRSISVFECYYIKTDLDKDELRKYFAFLFINNFMFAISGIVLSLWAYLNAKDVEKLRKMMERTDILLGKVAHSIVNISTFWVNYTTIKGLGVIMELTQIGDVIKTWARKFMLHPESTPRERREYLEPQRTFFSEIYAIDLFLFTLVVIFSVISPIIMIFGWLGFVISLIVYKYQILYVYQTEIETGGRLWTIVFNRVMLALLCFQIVMLGSLDFKFDQLSQDLPKANHNVLKPLLVLPLPFITLFFQQWHTRHYSKRFKYIDASVHSETLEEDESTVDELHHSMSQLELKYAQTALDRPLMRVLVNPTVATVVKNYYTGPFEVADAAGHVAPAKADTAATTMPTNPEKALTLEKKE